jgi:signal transduction histidine kinase
MADKRALHQIILNLMSNAIKFTPEGGQVIVSTTHTAEGDVIIRVKDTGIGMTDQELITALEPFRQLSTTRQSGGTGLGLPLTKALVEANRAAFSIKSARNAGTLVEITFPPTRVLTS